MFFFLKVKYMYFILIKVRFIGFKVNDNRLRLFLERIWDFVSKFFFCKCIIMCLCMYFFYILLNEYNYMYIIFGDIFEFFGIEGEKFE